ncbi:MAG: response regulator [Clostridiales bacterium]|jgi:YesN/AraC family two-component response regulator|nr:response regulator [Clostridiales bacterium]
MLNVFLVDDDRIVLGGLRRFVDWQSLGFQVAGESETARGAVEFMQTESVDVLLTDIMLPREDGFRLIENALLINPSLKTVILSSYSEFDFARKALRLGTFDYLTKPVNFQGLMEIFRKLRVLIEAETAERQEYLQGKREYLRRLPLGSLPAFEPVGFAGFAESVELSEPSEPVGFAETAAPCARESGNLPGPAIERVIDCINERFYENLTLETLSRVAFVHPVYLSKLFKEKTGGNFIDFLTKVRIEKAKLLLRDISIRICDVSDMVGYNSPKHFGRLFKEATGMTPKDFREQAGAGQ